MTLYILLAASPLLLTPIINSYCKSSVMTDHRARKALIVWFGLFLFVMIAFRIRFLGSPDSAVYYRHWGNVGGLDFSTFKIFAASSRFENGFLYTEWILSHIFPPEQFAFILSALLFTVAVCRFVYRYSPNPALSLVMFVALGEYTFMVQGLRQAIAMSICLMSLEFCRQRKLLKFLIVVLIASLFHQTAIVFAIVYFMYGFIMNLKMYAAIVAVGIVLFLLSDQIVALTNAVFETDYGDEIFESGGYIAVLTYIIILAVALIFAGRGRTDRGYTFFFLLTAMGFAFYIMRYFVMQGTQRISYYFMFGQMICLPMVLESFEKKTKGILTVFISVLCIALFMYRLNGGLLVPYRFFWQ